MKVEKIPSLICNECGSYCVTLTDEGFECDDCNRITVQTSDLLKERIRILETNLKKLEKINEVI